MFDIVDREYVWTYPINFSPIDGQRLSIGTKSWTLTEDLVVYIHIPFCHTNCPFCVFDREKYHKSRMNAFVTGLLKEIQYYMNWKILYNRTVSVIYFGGGTASLLKLEDIERIIQTLKQSLQINFNTEITIECHPLTVDRDYLLGLRELGINRVSFGIQSFQDELLQTLQIIQRSESNWKILQEARSVGFNSVNMDLLYRIPGQTFKMLEEDLQRAIDSDVTGISCYSLEVTDTELEGIEQHHDEIDREMFYFIGDFLEKHGMKQYAQPDFSRPGLKINILKRYGKHRNLGVLVLAQVLSLTKLTDLHSIMSQESILILMF